MPQMKAILTRLCSALLLCMLGSCTAYYQNPPDDPGRYGTIKNSFKGGANIFKYENYIVETVDGLPLNYRWAAPGKLLIRLAPGSRRIVLAASQSGGFQSVPYRTTRELTASIRAGRNYVPRGVVDGTNVLLWIEEEGSAKPASDKVLVPFQPAMQQGPPPIFIPPVMLQ